MRGLVAHLIANPPPGMRYFVVSGAVLIGLYMVLLPLDGTLQHAGTSAFVLANVVYLYGLMWWNMPSVRERLKPEGNSATFAGVATCFSLIATVFLVQDPIWVQRFFSGMMLLRLAMFGFALAFDPDWLRQLPWQARYWDTGRENAARWEVVGAAMLLLLNEAAIAFGTLDQWIGMRVLAPAVVYAIKWWTICLTHPYEDEDGA